MPAHHIRSYFQAVNNPHALTGDGHEARRYEIRIKGHIDARWTTWFDELTLTHDSDGTTLIHGPVADEAALHGLLQKVRDVGLPLVSVKRVETDQPDMPATDPRKHFNPPRRTT